MLFENHNTQCNSLSRTERKVLCGIFSHAFAKNKAFQIRASKKREARSYEPKRLKEAMLFRSGTEKRLIPFARAHGLSNQFLLAAVAHPILSVFWSSRK